MKYFLTKFSPKVINLLITVIVITVVILYLYFIRFQGNITGFFRIGSILELSPFLNPETTKIYQGEIGYDGQQFLSLALDPFLQNPETITTLDHPVYRYRRILYPLISYLFSFGNRILIPHIMVAINYLSVIGIIWIISLYFQFNQEQKWQPLLTLCIPGVWIVLSLGTADLLSSLLLIFSFYCYRYNKPVLTAFAISLACLARETLLLIWLAILLTSFSQNKKEQSKQLLWAWIPPFLWTIYINSLELPGAVRVKANFGYPFMGIYNKFISLLMGGFKGENLFEAYSFVLIFIVFVTILIISSYHRKDNQLIQYSTLLYGAMFVMSSTTILSYYLDYLRVFIDIYFFLLLSINTNKIPIKSILFAFIGLESFIFLALHS
ncbi:hypothetical protein RGRSB_1377 [cyanobacterium endosymbiont of Rhopalodia gibberula]|uniref:AZOBR_p60025 family cell surface glycopolymer formation protein n=1 Tax=cyanobacterium endosymbiont of Rhopalodia gibberula TaxID=1763363 RepID=UPI000DC70934|nr:hypothetical protein [cyanobacterium endosymbiont of Rhopalodia gibberula]BBA79817.1 hypothetical protein RGRSB_1377 [cyanobacterium endosymbiont of Rhopalodia gibberula]